MKGLCRTSILTSGSGSFPPVANINSEGNTKQKEKTIILIEDSSLKEQIAKT